MVENNNNLNTTKLKIQFSNIILATLVISCVFLTVYGCKINQAINNRMDSMFNNWFDTENISLRQQHDKIKNLEAKINTININNANNTTKVLAKDLLTQGILLSSLPQNITQTPHLINLVNCYIHRTAASKELNQLLPIVTQWKNIVKSINIQPIQNLQLLDDLLITAEKLPLAIENYKENNNNNHENNNNVNLWHKIKQTFTNSISINKTPPTATIHKQLKTNLEQIKWYGFIGQDYNINIIMQNTCKMLHEQFDYNNKMVRDFHNKLEKINITWPEKYQQELLELLVQLKNLP